MPRACVIVLDAVGAGELPDSDSYGDEGSNTIGNVARANENRIAFGRTKAEKNLSQAEQDLAKSRLDSHKRDDDEKT